MIGRILAGVSVGVNSTLVPLYIKEMSPDALKEINRRHTFVDELVNPSKMKFSQDLSGRTGVFT